METTSLKITINVGGQFAVSSIPTTKQLSSISTVKLDNGSFAQSLGELGLTVDPGVSVNVEFGTQASDKARSVKITTMGGLSGRIVVFPSSTIILEGLTVVLDDQPIALLGTMEHSVYTGSLVVSSTGNPQGDTLPSNVQSRAMALVP